MPQKRESIIISDFGMLYKLSKRNWKRYCEAYVKTGGGVSLYDYGAKTIGTIKHNITDWYVEHYTEELERIDSDSR